MGLKPADHVISQYPPHKQALPCALFLRENVPGSNLMRIIVPQDIHSLGCGGGPSEPELELYVLKTENPFGRPFDAITINYVTRVLVSILLLKLKSYTSLLFKWD
jgi:hypothetical protein